MNPDSIEFHYQALELPADADFNLARKHFRRLAQKLHPDLPNGDTVRFQQVQRAYDVLRRYHRETGALPLQVAPEPVTLAPGQGIRRRTAAKQRFWRRRRILLAVAALGGLIWVTWQLPEPPASSPPSTLPVSDPGRVHAPASTTRPQQTFDLGATLTDVIDIQGVPDERQQGSWFYGQSRIDFIDGKVAGWYEHPDTPLHIDHHRALDQSAVSDPVRTK